MLPITSQPYRIAVPLRQRVSRSLARGLRPLALNALVQVVAFCILLLIVFSLIDPLMKWIDARFGSVPPIVFGLIAALVFAVPWLALYLIWRRIWFAIIRRRVEAMSPAAEDLVATLDESGIRVDEKGLASTWIAWPAVTRLLLVDGALVVARGTFGLIVPVEVIGGLPALRELSRRVSPAALAASERSVRDAVA